MLLFFMLAYATIRIYQIGKGIRMTINVEYNDTPQNINVHRDPFAHFTDQDYEELAKVFPFIEDFDEDTSDQFQVLEDC